MIGLCASAIASMAASHVTSDWSLENFRPIVLLNTMGQCLCYFSSFVFVISNSDPKRSTATSAYIQVARIGSAELAASFMATCLRKREQYHSSVLGEHIQSGNPLYRNQLDLIVRALGHQSSAQAKSLAELGTSLRAQAGVMAYADCFLIAFWFAVVGLLFVAAMKAAPHGPLSNRLPREARD